MKTTKITTTAFELEYGQLVIGCSDEIFFVQTVHGIMEFTPEEMKECFELNGAQLENMKRVFLK